MSRESCANTSVTTDYPKSPQVEGTQPLTPSTLLSPTLFDYARSRHLTMYPSEFFLDDKHPLSIWPTQVVARPPFLGPPSSTTTRRVAPSTSHQVFQKLKYDEYMAMVRANELVRQLGVQVNGNNYWLFNKGCVDYPVVDEARVKAYSQDIQPSANQGRDLFDRHYTRFPYSANRLPSTSNDASFITYEQSAYTPYRCINGQLFMATVRTELPITPTPPSFLQPRFFFLDSPRTVNEDGLTLINILLDTGTSADPTLARLESSEFPVTLHDVVRNHSPWPLPTVTQIVDLTTKLVAEVDWLSPSLVFTPMLSTVYITNPSMIGSDKPLAFKLCPFALQMRDELGPSIDRNAHMRKFIAILIFELSLWVTDSYRLDFHHLIADAFVAAPGMLAAYHEVFREAGFNVKARLQFGDDGSVIGWHDPSKDPSPPDWAVAPFLRNQSRRVSYLEGLQDTLAKYLTHEGTVPRSDELSLLPFTSILSSGSVAHDRSIQSFSPTIATYNNVRVRTPREYELEHVPGLIQAASCVHSGMINSVAADGIYALLRKYLNSPRRFATKYGAALLNTCALGIGALVPTAKTGLTDPSSVTKSLHWIHRMFSVFIVLDEIEKTGEYSLLRMLQDVLLTAGIGRQLGGSLAGRDGKFALSVLVPVVCVSTLVSFRFPTLRIRLVFDRNVRKMAKMLIDARAKPVSAKADFPPIDTDRLIAMMMVMSDCGDWLVAHPSQVSDVNHAGDAELWRIFQSVDDDSFLAKVLPCWSPSLSPLTLQILTTRLVTIVEELASLCKTGPISQRASYKERLDYALDWCCHFAWNGSEQVAVSTYGSLYASYFMSLVFRNPCQLVLEGNQSHAHALVRDFATRMNQPLTTAPVEPIFSRMQIDERDASSSEAKSPLSATRPGIGLSTASSPSPVVSSTAAPTYLSASQLACFDSSDDENDEYQSFGMRRSRPTTLGNIDPFTSSTATVPALHVPSNQPASSCNSEYPFMRQDDPYNRDAGYQRLFTQPDALHAPVFARMATLDIHNVYDCPVLPRTHKVALKPVDLVNFVKHHQDPNHCRLYVPMTSKNGAPDGDSDCYLVLPSTDRRPLPFVQYHTPAPVAPVQGLPPLAITSLEGRHGSVRSVQAIEADKMIAEVADGRAPKFVPTTLAASNLPLCVVKERVTGTTGAMEVKLVDSGETNDLVIGITWSLKEEGIGSSRGNARHLEDIVPGFTPTSLGLCPNGVVHYIDASGVPVSTTCTAPFASGSKVVICVAYDRVYLIVDSVIYPPVPGLVLPKSAQVHGLFRFGCLGVKITMRHLSSTWNQNRNHDGSLVHATTNPIAHALYLAELRTKVCPHYHAQRLRQESLPNLSHIFPLSEAAGGSLEADWTPVIGSSMVEKIALIQLASEECKSEQCRAPAVLRAKIAEIAKTPVILPRETSTATIMARPSEEEGVYRRTLNDY